MHAPVRGVKSADIQPSQAQTAAPSVTTFTPKLVVMPGARNIGRTR